MVLTSLGRDQKKNIFVFQIAIFHARSQRVLLKPFADIKINNWNSAYLSFSWVVVREASSEDGFRQDFVVILGCQAIFHQTNYKKTGQRANQSKD